MAPEVQELTVKTEPAPESFWISDSRALHLGPVVIHPDRSVSVTSLITASSIKGGKNGIFIILAI